MQTLESNWESMKATVRDQMRQVMGRCILPLEVADFSEMVEDFCNQAAPSTALEMQQRKTQFNHIIDKVRELP